MPSGQRRYTANIVTEALREKNTVPDASGKADVVSLEVVVNPQLDTARNSLRATLGLRSFHEFKRTLCE